jgi:hypothetical protein
MAFPEPPQQNRPLWQYLLAPMLLLSLVLHGVVLFVPTGVSEDALVPPPDPEEDGIAISRIEPPASRAAATNPSNGAQTNPASGRRGATATSRGAQSGTGRSSGRSNNPGPVEARASQGVQNERRSTGNDTTEIVTLGDAEDPNAYVDVVVSADPMAVFLSFIDILETYGGVLSVDENQLTVDAASWLEALEADDPAIAAANLEIQPFRNFAPIPYLENICLPNPPGPAEILVLVEADGTVNPDVFTLKDTGYTHFDQVAETLVFSHDFPSVGEPKAYRVSVAVDYDEGDCQWPPPEVPIADEYLALVDSYLGRDGTRPLQAATARQDWLDKLVSQEKISSPTAQNVSAPDFQVPYDIGFCLPIAPTPIDLGVLVQADGSPIGEPELLRSSGYQMFNDRAKAMVPQFEFSAGESDRAMVLTVPVDYNPLTNVNIDPDEERC